jgi:hypothetical protein
MAVFRSLAVFLLSFSINTVAAQNSTTNSTYDVLQYVDQLIGSSNGGQYSSEARVGQRS